MQYFYFSIVFWDVGQEYVKDTILGFVDVPPFLFCPILWHVIGQTIFDINKRLVHHLAAGQFCFFTFPPPLSHTHLHLLPWKPLLALHCHHIPFLSPHTVPVTKTQSMLWEDRGDRPATFRHIPGFVWIERPIVPPCILLISWKRSNRHRGIGRVDPERVNGRGWGAPCWVVGFCAACKGKALFFMDADPAHCCMHAGSRLASAQSSKRKDPPTDDTQHTEDMDLYWEVTQPTRKPLYSLSVETHKYFMYLFICFTITLQDLMEFFYEYQEVQNGRISSYFFKCICQDNRMLLHDVYGQIHSL